MTTVGIPSSLARLQLMYITDSIYQDSDIGLETVPGYMWMENDTYAMIMPKILARFGIISKKHIYPC